MALRLLCWGVLESPAAPSWPPHNNCATGDFFCECVNDHDSADILCDECKSIIATLQSTNGVVLLKAFEQNFSVHQIRCVKSLAKRAIERGQQVDTLPCSSLQPPKSG